MKTIEGIVNKQIIAHGGFAPDNIQKIIFASMKEYAEDAIRECAERAETKPEHDYHSDGEGYDYSIVDKESILNLISELR